MPYRYAILWDLDDDSSPIGVVIEREGSVLVEVPEGYGIPSRYAGPYEVLQPDSSRVAYSPGDEAYFEHVLIDLSRVFAIADQGQVESCDPVTALRLLNDKVLRPQQASREGDYALARYARASAYTQERPAPHRAPERPADDDLEADRPTRRIPVAA